MREREKEGSTGFGDGPGRTTTKRLPFFEVERQRERSASWMCGGCRRRPVRGGVAKHASTVPMDRDIVRSPSSQDGGKTRCGAP